MASGFLSDLISRSGQTRFRDARHGAYGVSFFLFFIIARNAFSPSEENVMILFGAKRNSPVKYAKRRNDKDNSFLLQSWLVSDMIICRSTDRCTT
jgi:hypothetical protein